MEIYDSNVLAAVNFVIQNEKILMVQETQDHNYRWYFPAGRVDIPENLIDAVIRETLEETGLQTFPRLLLEIQYVIAPNQLTSSGYETSIRFVVISDLLGGELKTQADEHSQQAAWIALEDVLNLPLRHKGEVERIIHKYKTKIENEKTFPLLSDTVEYLLLS